jgi:hypothetical protein
MKQTLFMIGGMAVLVFAARGQSYTIDWFKVSGGGGASTGSIYSVSGTIGQQDAGQRSQAGNFSVVGGFWSFLAVQTPGAPFLTIRGTATNSVIVLWPSPSAGWSLQQNASLTSSIGWTIPGEVVSDDGINKFIVVKTTADTRFYRLVKP